MTSHPPASARPLARTAGFTLVEMLVALAILGLFASYLPQAYGLVRRTWTLSAELARDNAEQAARYFLLTRLAEASPVFEKRPEGDELAFSGKPETLSFVAPLAHAPRGSGLYRFRIFHGPDANGRGALQVALEPYIGRLLLPESRRDDTAADVHRLMPAAGMTVRYFGRPAPRENALWLESWSRIDAFPDLVEITLRRTDGTSAAPIAIELRLRSGQ